MPAHTQRETQTERNIDSHIFRQKHRQIELETDTF